MRRITLALTVAVVATLAAAEPAGATPDPADEGASGSIQLTVHTHSSNPSTLLFPDVARLSYDVDEGDTFAYSSRTCDARAPFNEVGLNFLPDYPGVDDDDGTAAVRHLVEGTVTDVHGPTGRIEGTITTVLCEDGEVTEHVIVSDFEATYRLVSEDQLAIAGTFWISPDDSTGTFAGLRGHGSIRGVFTCLGDPVCADVGQFTDFVAARGDLTAGPGEIHPGLVGTFSDSSVDTA